MYKGSICVRVCAVRIQLTELLDFFYGAPPLISHANKEVCGGDGGMAHLYAHAVVRGAHNAIVRIEENLMQALQFHAHRLKRERGRYMNTVASSDAGVARRGRERGGGRSRGGEQRERTGLARVVRAQVPLALDVLRIG